jgi:hypothetical protein
LVTVAGLEPAASQLEVDNPLPPARCRAKFGKGLAEASALPLSYTVMLSNNQIVKKSSGQISAFGMGASLWRRLD